MAVPLCDHNQLLRFFKTMENDILPQKDYFLFAHQGSSFIASRLFYDFKLMALI